MLDATETPAQTPEQERIAQLEEALAAARLELTDAQGTIVRLRRAYTLEQLQLMRRRLFLAKAERDPSATPGCAALRTMPWVSRASS